MKPPSNQEIAQILRGISEYLAMQKVQFKPQAYQRAAIGLEEFEREASLLYAEGGIKALKGIPGIGQSIAEHIEELVSTGRLAYYENLKKETPVDVAGLSGVEGLGPKNIEKLYKALGVRTVEDLEKAATAGKIRELKGFGEKMEQKILGGLEFAKDANKRFQLGVVASRATALERRLGAVPGVERVIAAGSWRRRKETVGDLDILVAAEDAAAVTRAFIETPGVVRVLAEGETRSSVRFATGLQVDLRVVPRESYGAALNYFTGSKEHNVRLRQLAIKKGLKLNEYGLFSVRRGKEKMVAGATEAEVYAALGLPYIEPEIRENRGEIEAAIRQVAGETGGLPELIGYKDIRGDLQVQTDWTDGKASIEAMALEAAKRGLEYIAITDHTKRLAMTNGLDEARIEKQMAEIDRVNKKLKGKIIVLKGTECDILKDGTLDIADETLAKLDVVGVSVHSHFNLPEKDQTERVLRAVRNPHADIFFHPTGRIIGRRPPITLNMPEVIAAAKDAGTVLEVNSYPDRLDLKDDHIRMAVEAGVKLAIDSDAHAPNHFGLLEYGISQARRGWATRSDIINAWPWEKARKFLKG